MNEHNSRSTDDSPFQLLGTMFSALTDALNMRHLRTELYDPQARIDLMPEPRLTVVAPSWSVAPSLTQQNLTDQQAVLQAAPFEGAARHRM